MTAPTLRAQSLPTDPHSLEFRALVDIYRLDAEGHETPLSLTAVNWRPSEDASLLYSKTLQDATATAKWFPLLALSRDGEPEHAQAALALGQVTPAGSRRAALGANLIHDLRRPHETGGRANARAEAWLENLITWLVERDMPFAPVDVPVLNVSIAQMAGLDGHADDDQVGEWLKLRGQHIKVSTAGACDGDQLVACLDTADLLIIGSGRGESQDSTRSTRIGMALQRADELGVPVLFMHEGTPHSTHASATLDALGLDARQGPHGLQVTHASGSRLVSPAPVVSAAMP